MKELSIEQKAHLYDEALKVLHKYDGANIMFSQSLKEEMFSELAESEDENTRKAVLKAFKIFAEKQAYVGHCLDDIDWDKCIAWIEKQGEQKPAEWHREDEQNLNACLGYIPDEFLRRWLTDIIHVKYDKLADKVEPKFKVGDWVVRGKTIAQILDIQKQYYVGLDIDGNDFTSSRFLSDDKIHLWTIQDAKDGDVLTTDTWTFIFKKYQDKSVCYHCAASAFNNFSISDTGEFDSNYVHPATKEQRDTLFAKIKEAGYEWDADMKELKEIGFNPDDLIEESHQQQADDLIDMVTEKSAEWSEEDEKIHRKCICAMRASACGFPEEEKFVEQVDNWLKSLKERYTWKPSDVQMDAVKDALDYLGENTKIVRKHLMSLYGQLKKLKEG
jgi:hypothetical protein